MNRRTGMALLGLGLVSCALGAVAHSHFQKRAGANVVAAAETFVATLSDEQKEIVIKEYDSEERVGWHFIPKDERKGLQVKHMKGEQRRAAMDLLRSSLSRAGFRKARTIMKLEGLLAELEKGRDGGPIRDTERYYFTLFGSPGEGRWGLSMEGHHLSLNFVLEGNQVISSTPAFFAANPGVVKNAGAGIKKGTRVLADEELLAFDLVNSLSAKQKTKGIIAEKAPREIRAAGEPQPPTEAPAGIGAKELTDDQMATLKKLITTYSDAMRPAVARARLAKIEKAGPQKVHFAWAGATEPGIGHYYRVQGPTFLIEFVNTQPDAAGNPANHIHCVWRDMAGDFALPIK